MSNMSEGAKKDPNAKEGDTYHYLQDDDEEDLNQQDVQMTDIQNDQAPTQVPPPKPKTPITTNKSSDGDVVETGEVINVEVPKRSNSVTNKLDLTKGPKKKEGGSSTKESQM